MSKSPNEDEILDDLCVRREEIEKLFHPPPTKATFHRWVNEGVVVMARGLSGYYLLNKTRVRLGMNPVDVGRLREALQHPGKEKAKREKEAEIRDIRANPPNYMNIHEAAEYLTVSPRFLRSQIAEWNIKYVKASRRIILRKQDLDKYAERQLRGPNLF